MAICIRCRETLANENANYCGACGFPILDSSNEEEIRELGRRELDGFLDGFDVETIVDTMNEERDPPSEPYQWYLEEGVKKALADIAILQKWDWFQKVPISRLFFTEGLFDGKPSDEALQNFMIWARVSAFFFEAFQPAGLELSITIGAVFADEIDSIEDIDITISLEDDENESNVTDPAS